MSDNEICTNCKKSMPSSKIPTHFGYCRRNIIKCQTCGEMYDKNFQEDHEQQFHNSVKCQNCKVSFTKKQAENHSKVCTMKPKFCQYCENNVPVKQFNLHYKQCESRTVRCEKCQKLIINKEFIVHKVICVGKVKPAAAPKKSSYQFQDSLTNFYQKDLKENPFNPSKNAVNQKQKDNKVYKMQKDKPNLIANKKQPANAKKQQIKKQIKKQPNKQQIKKQQTKQQRKQIKQPQQLKKQQFYNNYFNPEFAYNQDYEQFNGQDYYMNDNQSYYGGGNIDYLPNQSFYNNSINDYNYTPKNINNANVPDVQLDVEDQLMQMTLMESRQNRKNNRIPPKNQLPKDFYSQDIMNKSFYTDILDIEKQKAIMEQISKEKNNKKNNATKSKK